LEGASRNLRVYSKDSWIETLNIAPIPNNNNKVPKNSTHHPLNNDKAKVPTSNHKLNTNNIIEIMYLKTK